MFFAALPMSTVSFVYDSIHYVFVSWDENKLCTHKQITKVRLRNKILFTTGSLCNILLNTGF